MNSLFTWLQGKKTYIVAFAAAIYGAGIQTGLWAHSPVADAVLAASGLATLRASVAKAAVQLVMLGGLLILTGCAHVNLIKVGADGSKTAFIGTTLLSNTTFKGLLVDGTTKTTSKALWISGAVTEPNPEAITATASGLGDLIGAAAAATAKGMGVPSLPSLTTIPPAATIAPLSALIPTVNNQVTK